MSIVIDIERLPAILSETYSMYGSGASINRLMLRWRAARNVCLSQQYFLGSSVMRDVLRNWNTGK